MKSNLSLFFFIWIMLLVIMAKNIFSNSRKFSLVSKSFIFYIEICEPSCINFAIRCEVSVAPLLCNRAEAQRRRSSCQLQTWPCLSSGAPQVAHSSRLPGSPLAPPGHQSHLGVPSERGRPAGLQIAAICLVLPRAGSALRP